MKNEINDIHSFNSALMPEQIQILRTTILSRLRIEEPTLRDQFAMAASYEELATPEKVGDAAKYIGVTVEEYNSTIHWYKVVAKARYELADAMMEARKQEPR